MLSPADQNANQLGLRKYHLTFLDRRMEKQYRLVTSREALKYSRIAYLVGLIFFGGYSLGQSLILKDDVYTYSRMGVFLGFALFIFVLYTEVYRTKYFSVTFLVRFLKQVENLNFVSISLLFTSQKVFLTGLEKKIVCLELLFFHWLLR